MRSVQSSSSWLCSFDASVNENAFCGPPRAAPHLPLRNANYTSISRVRSSVTPATFSTTSAVRSRGEVRQCAPCGASRNDNGERGRHCEEQRDEAIQAVAAESSLGCFAYARDDGRERSDFCPTDNLLQTAMTALTVSRSLAARAQSQGRRGAALRASG